MIAYKPLIFFKFSLAVTKDLCLTRQLLALRMYVIGQTFQVTVKLGVSLLADADILFFENIL